ncbi:MAG: YbhB/YbcL family Raf kinase inhibitor-like protein [Methanosarcinales archaeon]|jgi:Raf kinase inhibitor-like YbhB/YbcL family protein|nr:YbhB/YbcL family Raf kinase inhibitor-like protein [Methanosarcinales archaeon]
MNLVLCARLPTNGWQIRTAYLPVTGKMYEELAANEVGLDISGCSYVNPAGKSSQPQKGKNDFGRIGYNGPCPPPGKAHKYFFKVYALDITLDLKSGATEFQLEAAMSRHILAQGEMIGKYGR